MTGVLHEAEIANHSWYLSFPWLRLWLCCLFLYVVWFVFHLLSCHCSSVISLYVLFCLHFQFTFIFLESVGASISVNLCIMLFLRQPQPASWYEGYLIIRWRPMVAWSWQFLSWLGCCLFWHIYRLHFLYIYIVLL